MMAWHFNNGNTLFDHKKLPPIGVTMKHKGKVVPSSSGLHACLEPFDAIMYGSGPILDLVEIGGTVVQRGNLVAGSERTRIVSMDATPLLRYFARIQALSVAHLWEPTPVMLDYLMTGDEALRSDAFMVARPSMFYSATVRARNAGRYSVWAVAKDAIWAATWTSTRAPNKKAARKFFNDLVYASFEDWL